MLFTEKKATIYLLVLFITGCSFISDKTPQTENSVLNKLLQSAEITTINLDEIPVDTVLAQEENTMGKTRLPSLTSPATLDRPVDLAKIGDSLYVADGGQQCIWVMDNQGKWIRRIGRTGNGPGEFSGLEGIDGNSDYIFTFDKNNARIQVYDHQFNMKSSFERAAISSGREIVVNDHAIYMLADYTEQNNLIGKLKATPPFDTIGSFLSPIIPYGRQPLAYNNYVIAANNDNQVAMAFVGLPYLFILDSNQQVDQILYLESSLWEEIKKENPSVKPVEYASRENGRVVYYILHLYLSDNGSIYLRTQDAFYILGIENGSYRLKEAIEFVTNEKIVPGRSGSIRVPSKSMYVKGDTIYFASGFTEYIYRFPVR
ncbi:6-bladed beta-propeller [Aliifodinibius salicampi]|uniref:6-bladed beta-propeller n=1 Tax=Fodinibius salicampi TaxID=1920655 RepID=A0ABT3PWL6_9BACT|nr:6-bladed beta-propeller [Fodinibius salicampi]MCW9712240.1 6-bladed beta-propeller [Fodinibius salicampi]